MSDKVKKFDFKEGWLNIDYNGLFNQKQMNIDLRHISLVEWRRIIDKLLFFAGSLAVLVSFGLMIIMFDFERDMIIMGAGIVLIIFSFLIGKNGIVIYTDAKKMISIPGLTKEEFDEFLQEITKSTP
jgi:hypothetical protein